MKTMILNGILQGGPEKIQACVDELVYRSYSYNRSRTTDITPERWKLCFNDVDAMEKRFQRELRENKMGMN